MQVSNFMSDYKLYKIVQNRFPKEISQIILPQQGMGIPFFFTPSPTPGMYKMFPDTELKRHFIVVFFYYVPGYSRE